MIAYYTRANDDVDTGEGYTSSCWWSYIRV